MESISQLDWARLAAYIDGEGCVSISSCAASRKGWRGTYLQVVVSNTDPRLTEWCQMTFGGRCWVNRKKHPKWKPCFRWMATCRLAAEILTGCLPYFLLKREQAEIGLAFQRTVKRVGVKGHTEETLRNRLAYAHQISVLKDRGNRQADETAQHVPSSIM